MVPGCFDQQPSHVGVADFGDRSLDPRGSRGVFAGHQSDVGADRGAGEPRPVADLHRQRQAGERGDTAQAAQPIDWVSEAW